MTLLGGNLGLSPPPTNAIMFVLYNISTIPIPPSNSKKKGKSSKNRFFIYIFTSMESIFEGIGVIDPEPVCGAAGKAAVVLVKTYV